MVPPMNKAVFGGLLRRVYRGLGLSRMRLMGAQSDYLVRHSKLRGVWI